MDLSEIKGRIREKSNIVDVMAEYIRLQKVGKRYRAICPFHQDTKPSLYIDPEKEMFHCFGCGAGGDVFNFIMLIERLDFMGAMKLLAERAGITIGDIEHKKGDKDRLMEIVGLARDFYEANLRRVSQNHPAKRFLNERGISDRWLEFGIGYTGDKWGGLVEFLNDKGVSEEDGERAGIIYRDDSGVRDYLNKRLVFVISNLRGNAIALAGRGLAGEEPKYLNTPNTDIFHKGRVLYNLNRALPKIKETRRAIVVEGYMDVIGLALVGVKEAVAPMGTALTSEQAQLISRYADIVYLLFDGDDAGERATIRSLPALFAQDVEVFVVRPPDGLDPDELARRDGSEGINRALDNAYSGWDYMLKSGVEEYDINTPMGKSNLVEAFLEPLASIRDEVRRGVFIEELAKVVSIDRDLIKRGVENRIRGRKRATANKQVLSDIKTVKDKKPPLYEIELLNIILSDGRYMRRAVNEINLNGITDQRVRRIVEQASELSGRGINDTRKLMENLDSETTEVASKALFMEIVWDVETAFNDLMSKINSIAKRRELADKMYEIFGSDTS
ncbi:MAG TPA: DNA primase [Firmicutes bacterium]|nr:DNA primase [Bacillota bacterium]